jgi:hypothetical protein
MMNQSTGQRLGLGLKLLSIAALISLFSPFADAQLQTFSDDVLYTFSGALSAGTNPVSLVRDGAGNFYGATQSGGTGPCVNSLGERIGCGAVFELTPDGNGGWTYNVIYSLQGGFDGQSVTSLSIDNQGNLYGTTTYGNGSLNGAAFEISREPDGTWILSNAYDFTGVSDGAQPSAPLIVDWVGNVYGTSGVVFELQLVDNQWIEKTLNNSVSTKGALTMDSKGDLYGTFPGYNSSGYVFKLHNSGAKGWVLNTLYSFQGGPNDGASPSGPLVFDQAGNLYGTAAEGLSSGFGGVYKLTKSGKITWLYTFTGRNDGANSYSGVVFDQAGNLYGAAKGGNPGGGVVYELVPSKENGTTTWTEGTLYSFTGGKDGDAPDGPILFDNAGNLYGDSFYGGTGYGSTGFGTIYKLTPNPVDTVTAILSTTPTPSKAGQAVNVSLSVAQAVMAKNKPTGTVTVSASTGEGCIAVIPAKGTRISCNLLFDSAGARTLTATYSGDAGDLSSVSGMVTQTVMDPTRTKITRHSPDPAKVGHVVTVEFSVEAKYGTKQTNPTGGVTVTASTGESCSGTIAPSGKGKCQLTFATTGVRTMIASYPGDSDNDGSVSAAVEQSVE